MKLVKYLLFIIIASSLVAGLYFGYRFYMQAKEKSIDAIYIIPENAAIIVGVPKHSALKKEWKKAGELAELFEEDQLFKESLNNLDSSYSRVQDLFLKKNKDLSFYYSIHFVGHQRFESMLSFSINEIISEDDFKNAIKKLGKIKEREFESSKIYEFKFNKNKTKYFIALEHSNIFISKYEPLIERLILEEESNSIEKHNTVKKMIKIRGKDAPATVYLNYKYLYRLISTLSQVDYIDINKQISNLSQHSVLDFNTQKNSISFNGYSFCTDSIANLLSTFNGFDAPTIEIFKHIPAQTIALYYQGAQRFNKYITNKSKTSFSTINQLAIKSYKTDLMVNVTDYFYPWIKSELAFGLLSDNAGGSEGYAIADTYDSKEAIQLLGKLKSIAAEYKNVTIDTIDYRSYKIHYIPLPYLLPNIFGKLFSPIQQTYYCNVNNYIIFATSPKIIESYIDNILIDKTLANRDDFDTFQSKISLQANLMIYVNMHYYTILSKQFLGIKANSYLKSSSINLNKIGDVAIEFIEDNNGAYTSINISKNNWEEEADKVSWQVALDYPIAKGPFLYKNHQTNKTDIIVFDTHNQMYRINHLGVIAWAIPVAELPLGDISIVDFYKNNKHQFLYNSKNNIYLFDVNGNKVENYPLALNTKATAPLTLVDYDNNRNYRIIIPMADRVIHNFKIDGSETPGWKKPQMPFLVNTKVQYFRLGKKDFLILADTAGNVLFSNRRGEARIEAKLAFTNDINTKFYQLGDMLITTDKIGRIIYIDATGQVNKKILGNFSNAHTFYFIDVNGDNKKDFLFLDKNSIIAFNQKGDTIWSKKLHRNIYTKVESLQSTTIDSCNILSYNTDNNSFELINPKGVFIKKEEYSASDNFKIYKTTKDKQIRLITAKNRVISNYLLK